MLSTCPSCLSQVQHQDHLSQVTCSCGVTFPTIMELAEQSVDTEEADSFHSSVSPLQNEDLNELDNFRFPDSPATVTPVQIDAEEDYSESATAFEAIIDFGEQLDTAPSAPQIPPAPALKLPDGLGAKAADSIANRTNGRTPRALIRLTTKNVP